MQSIMSKPGFERSWHDVKKLVTKCIQHLPHYGTTDREEMQGEANLAFCEAYHTHDAERGAFTTHVFNRARYALLNYRKVEAKRVGREVSINLLKDFDPPGETRRDFNYQDLLSGLSPDGKFVVEKARRLPELIEQETGEERKLSPDKLRKMLLNYLDAIGWDEERILDAWSEAVKAFA